MGFKISDDKPNIVKSKGKLRKEDTVFFIVGLISITIVGTLLYEYLYNIYDVIKLLFSDNPITNITFFNIMQIIGIFVPPIGIITGFML